MVLVPVQLPDDAEPLPADVRAFIREAQRQVRAFMDQTSDHPPAGFVPSDFTAAYRALRTISARRLAPGDALLEWGSGYGVVAMLGTMLDFDAVGIEVHRELVELAESLAGEYELPAEFVQGSFLPADSRALADVAVDFEVLDTTAPSAYAALGREIEDFDIIYAFPWPGEEQTITRLFDAAAADGALLLTYHGLDDIVLRRKQR